MIEQDKRTWFDIVLRDIWKEFCNKHTDDMYRSKICYTTQEVDEDNIRVLFNDDEGYEMLYNFLQRKKSTTL